MINIFYSLFFILLNLMIYVCLVKRYRNLKLVVWVFGLVLFSIVLHLFDVFEGRLMSMAGFYHILIFSGALIVLHYMGKIMDARRRGMENRAISMETLFKYERVTFFVRNKLIYVMTTIYQILAIYVEDLRS